MLFRVNKENTVSEPASLMTDNNMDTVHLTTEASSTTETTATTETITITSTATTVTSSSNTIMEEEVDSLIVTGTTSS